MILEFREREFRFQIASDVHNDTMTLEAWELQRQEGQILVLEVVRQDPLGVLSLSAYAHDLPIELIEYMIVSARQRLLCEGWNDYQKGEAAE